MTMLYYEAHVTFEPVFDARLVRLKDICSLYGFSVADLLMQKRAEDTPERSKHDTFATTRSKVYADIEGRTKALVQHALGADFKVWRYKIEDTVMDSKILDTLALLGPAEVLPRPYVFCPGCGWKYEAQEVAEFRAGLTCMNANRPDCNEPLVYGP